MPFTPSAEDEVVQSWSAPEDDEVITEEQLPPLPAPATPEGERNLLQSEMARVREESPVARWFGTGPSVIPPLFLPPEDAGSLENVLQKLPLGTSDESVREARARGIGSALRSIEGGVRGAGQPENLPLLPLAAVPGVGPAMGLYFGGTALGEAGGTLAALPPDATPEQIGAPIGQAILGGAIARQGAAGRAGDIIPRRPGQPTINVRSEVTPGSWIEPVRPGIDIQTDLAREVRPQTTEVPSAIHREAERPVRALLEQGRQETRAGEVPAVVEGEGTGARSGVNADQAEAPARPDVLPLTESPGVQAIRRVEAMPDDQAAKLNQRAESFEGITFDEADLPALRAAREASHKRWMAALEATMKNPDDRAADIAQQAEGGRNIWLSAAIEIAKKEGPNYEAMQAEKAKAALAPKVTPAATVLKEVPEVPTGPEPRDRYGVSYTLWNRGIDESIKYFDEFNQQFSHRKLRAYRRELVADALADPQIVAKLKEAGPFDPEATPERIERSDFAMKVLRKENPEIAEVEERLSIPETESARGYVYRKLQDEHPEISAEEIAGILDDYTNERAALYEISPGIAKFVDMSGIVGKIPQEFEAEPEANLESRIPQTAGPAKQNIFDLEDELLGDMLDERFGEQPGAGQPGEIRRTGTYSFPTYDQFKKWMDDRYAALDIEGMRNAFAEAPTDQKIRYIKENKGADDHKRAWITHLATGAELPKERPPVAQPRVVPGAGGAPQPAPVPGQPPPSGQPPPRARPAPPPPPPRAPTPYRKFDVMALTQMFRQFGNFPKMNMRLIRAYGRFIPKTEMVELKQRLLWDTALAERVLAHEIGHFIDLAVQVIGKDRKFAEKLTPFKALRARLGTDRELRNDARALSRQWRGNFQNGDPYRDSANELFADFMSAMFNNPEWVNQNFPRLHDALAHVLSEKPSFREAYREIESWLQGGTMAAEWIAQQEGAVRRTVDDLMQERPRHRESFRDVLKGAFVSTWHRAFEAEGKPRSLGKSITDDLEYNAAWAAKENALFADDFTKMVQPQLEMVNADPIKARADLHAYSQARRTIGERRAAGQWIEQHPAESFDLLQAILNLDPDLKSKFQLQLDSIGQGGPLYDLSAAIFREIHDRGERFVKRMAREIDDMQLGVRGDAALQAFNVRGKLLNPGGLTEANAVKVLQQLRTRLTPDQWRALEGAASKLRDLLFEVQAKAHAEGLISDGVWNELIVPNRGNYMPYAVLDYWEGRVRAGVMPQKGTAMDIADVTVSAQLKIAALNGWRQRQRQVQLLRDAYQAGGTPIPVGQRLQRASDIDQIRKRHAGDDISRSVLWRNGRPHLVEFPADPGKTLELAMDQAAFYEHLYSWLAQAGGLTHGLMQLYTTLSIPFLVYRNPLRGARTGALRVGFRGVARQTLSPQELTHATELARNYADAAFGAPMLPEVRALVENQTLLPPRLSGAMVRDAANLRELLENGGILATQLRQLRGQHWPWWKGGQFGQESFKFAEKVFTGYEAFEKIQNYLAAKARGLTEAQAIAIGRRAGIPKPGVGGHFSLPMEVFFPWTRVHIQGVRSTLDFLRDPQFRKGFATRFMITEGMPRVLKVGIGIGVASGLISWLVSPDEDEKDPVMAEVFRRISPYKMALDDMVPLMLYDPRKGEYHYFSDFKKGSAIPQHYEVVSFRIPASEEGRLWGTLLYNTLISIPGAREKLARPGEDIISSVGKWAVNYLAPGVSPAITTTANLEKMIVEGKNPEDPYRGQPSANRQLFDAGGVDRAQAIAGYTLNELGGPGELAAVMAMNFGVLDERAADALKKRLSVDKTPLVERLPLAKNMFSYDNYAAYRTEKLAELDEEKVRARARLVMSDSVRGLYDYYWRNNKRKDLPAADRARLAQASYFVNRIWGDLRTPGSFYSRAVQASGPDGSAQARETVRRDLDQAAAIVLAGFQRQ